MFFSSYFNKIKRKINKFYLKYKIFKAQKRNIKISKLFAKCGNNLKIFGNISIYNGEKITIGNDCNINDNVYLNGRSGIVIGNDVTLSAYCKLVSSGYDIESWLSKGEKKHLDNKPIVIGSHCWIGVGAIILPGVTISGEYVIIGAGAVVTKDIEEDYVLVAGNPAQIKKRYKTTNG